MRRRQWYRNALISFICCFVGDHVSAAYRRTDSISVRKMVVAMGIVVFLFLSILWMLYHIFLALVRLWRMVVESSSVSVIIRPR